MNEREFRERLRKSVGEHGYPPDLTSRIQASLSAPKVEQRPRTPFLLALVAALLAVAMAGTLVYVGQSRNARHTVPGTPPTASPKGDTSVPDGLWPRLTNFAYDSTREEVVLFGGYSRTPTDDTWTWDGSRWNQRTSAAKPSPRWGGAIADDPANHVVVLFGGRGMTDGYNGDTWLWNGTEWSQVFSAHSPSPRDGAAATYDPINHVVLLFGGSNGNALSDTWVWDGKDWTAKSPTKSPPPRRYGRLAFDSARGNAVLYGGFDGMDDTWTWDGTSWTERHPGNTPPGYREATPFPAQMAYDAARKVIVFVVAVHHASETAKDTAETWTWNGSTWTAPATPTPLRYNYGLAYDQKRSVIVLAGGWAQHEDGTTTWGWNGASWTGLAGPMIGLSPPTRSTAPSSNPWPRSANFAYDSTRGEVMLFGGGTTGLGSSDTWTWNGRSWVERSSSSRPSARFGSAISDDPDHHVVVLFGGKGGGKTLGDTWLWDGSNWKQVFPAHSPSPRAGAAITYDPVHHVVLLFGGEGLNDTWTWDGNDWTQKRTATSSVATGPRATAPAGRTFARLAFDVARGNAVLYGGFYRLTDTWTWDGSTWTQRLPSTTPPPTYEFTPVPQQMVYDAARQVIVFVDEQDHTGECTSHTMDTWTWNGSNWRQMVTTTSPPIRGGYGLAHDAKHSLTVFAGGGTCSYLEEASTWGWNGSAWSKIG
jgi:hypothetical protein